MLWLASLCTIESIVGSDVQVNLAIFRDYKLEKTLLFKSPQKQFDSKTFEDVGDFLSKNKIERAKIYCSGMASFGEEIILASLENKKEIKDTINWGWIREPESEETFNEANVKKGDTLYVIVSDRNNTPTVQPDTPTKLYENPLLVLIVGVGTFFLCYWAATKSKRKAESKEKKVRLRAKKKSKKKKGRKQSLKRKRYNLGQKKSKKTLGRIQRSLSI